MSIKSEIQPEHSAYRIFSYVGEAVGGTKPFKL